MRKFQGGRFGSPGGGGGGAAVDASVAYVRESGNDSTGAVGGNPFLTGTAAWLALKAFHNDVNVQHSFDFGQGEFEIEMSIADLAAGYSLFARGVGREATVLTMANPFANGDPGAEGAAGIGAGLGTDDTGGTGGTGGTGDNAVDIVVDLTLDSDHSVGVVFDWGSGTGGAGGDGGVGGAGDGTGDGGIGGDGGVGGDGGDISGELRLNTVVANTAGIAAGDGGVGGDGGSGGAPGGGGGVAGVDGSVGATGNDGAITLVVTSTFSLLDSTDYGQPAGNYFNGAFQT